MSWVKGHVFGEITSDKRIIARTTNLQVMEGVRPRHISDSWATAEVFERIRQREPGNFETMAFMGGAGAFVIPFSALALLPERLMDKLREKYGQWGQDAYIALVRNTGAPYVWNAAEPSGGMAENTNLILEQLCEMVEVGVYCDEGWVRFVLPKEMAHCQDRFDREQEFWWGIARPGFSPCASATLEILPFGRDEFNSRRGVLAVGPVGDFSFTLVVKLHLKGTGWKILDTEARPGRSEASEPEWTPLLRQVVAIAPRSGKSPLVFQMTREGVLDERGLHFVLEGENRDLAISHLSRAVLEALDWFPKEKSQ